MQYKTLFAAIPLCVLLAACSTGSDTEDTGGTTPPPIPEIVAEFDPAASVIPFPNNLLFSGTTDLTLNIPVVDPSDISDPAVALNALDGFSTVAPWSTSFSAMVDAATVLPGQTVHLFEVTLSSPAGAVTSVVRELESPAEYVATVIPGAEGTSNVAFVPTAPLKPRTSYMAVITGFVLSDGGAPVTASLTYTLAKGATPLCVNGQSTSESLTDAQACALEPVRQLVNAQEAAAATAGVDRTKIALSWVATTQSTALVLQVLPGAMLNPNPAPAAAQIAPTGMGLGDLGLGLPPLADIYIGVVGLPYYLGVPSAGNPTAPLTASWHAAPGAYVPPADQFGLDPTSTHVTAYNPVPVANATLQVPLILTIPNAASGHVRPATGWPIVIFQHGITRNRTDMLAVAGTLASQGYATIAIDTPLHGLPASDPFNIENTPFGALADERTFGIDFIDNATGAPGPDGVADPSGAHFINLASLLTSRDNLRQAVADLLQLAHGVPGFNYDGVAGGDFDANHIAFVGQSLGGIIGTVFTAVDQTVDVAVLNVAGGGIAGLLQGSVSIGPQINAGLEAAGVVEGTAEYQQFFVAAQTVIDPADPINFAAYAAGDAILVQEVVGNEETESLPDQVVPNSVAGAPLSGTEPLIAALGLTAIDASVESADPLRVATRFVAGAHGSLLDPTASPLVTAEMQGEMASLIASMGHAVQVTYTEVLQAVEPPAEDDSGDGS